MRLSDSVALKLEVDLGTETSDSLTFRRPDHSVLPHTNNRSSKRYADAVQSVLQAIGATPQRLQSRLRRWAYAVIVDA